MGRAIVRNPQVFCMDEPLSNLDAKLRVATRTQIASLQRRLGVTTVYVTHDQVEAMTMGDRVAVLKDGILQQVDRPRHMYDRPANMFVAGFIGSPAMNLFQIPVSGNGTPRLGGHDIPIERDVLSTLSGGTVALGVRPEDLHVVGSGEGIAATVELVEELGSDAFVHASVEQNSGDNVVLVARVNPKSPPEKGQKVWLAPEATHQMHVFDPADGRRLSA
jgi:multiple sugar transport system ATP-binding protein